MVATSFVLPVHSFRTLPTPLETQGIRSYTCVVPVHEIPKEFRDWLDVNAREPSTTGRVAKAIRGTLNEAPERFVVYNRGLAILASSVDYNNQTREVTLTFADKKEHGIFDGGHTLAVILEERGNRLNEEGNEEEAAFCRLEIMTGVPVELLTELVEARNTSRQVASKSLLNLEGRFQTLKNTLGSSLVSLIAWKENEDAPIDIRELVALLTAFDATHYNDVRHPIQTYSGKEACLNHFELSPGCYQKLYPVARDVLRLSDEIQAAVPDQYNQLEGGRFGGLKGCDPLNKPRQLPVIGGSTRYQFPNGYLYPIVAAFRAMLVETSGTYTWGKGIDPCRLVRDGLATKIFSGPVVNSIRAYHNPNRTGKDVNVWALAYQMAENHYLRL